LSSILRGVFLFSQMSGPEHSQFSPHPNSFSAAC